MGKKYVGYGDFFCTNCGARMEKGAKKCPDCGSPYSGKHHYDNILDVEAQRTYRHPSFLRYKLRTLRGIVICMVLEALFIAGLLVLDDSFDPTIFKWILVVVLGFQAIWIIFNWFSPRKWRQLQAANRAHPQGPHACLMCPNRCDRRDNFCGRCGCIILK